MNLFKTITEHNFRVLDLNKVTVNLLEIDALE